MTKDMTRGTPWKLIVQFALPIMAGNLLQQLYNTADTIIVGNFNSQQALSAVGSCASLTALFTALAIGFSIGAGVLISQYFGANRLEDLRRYASSSIVLMLALGLLMSVLGFCSAELFLEKFLGTPQSLLPQAALYFKIYAVGLVFQFGYNIAAAILRALGDSRATLYFLLVSSVLNVVLDLLFVAGFHMGVAGAAIATVLSQLASCVVGFSYMRRRYELLAHSYHCRFGEIDLIARKGGVLCFVEVKTRSNLACGLPREYVTTAKQERILRGEALHPQDGGFLSDGKGAGLPRPLRRGRGLYRRGALPLRHPHRIHRKRILR